jgi:hypothetical protein
MELVTHRIPVKSRQKDEILVMPIGDIQWAGDKKEVAIDMLKRHIEWGVEHNALFLGMGDYIDFMSPSNRERLKGAGLYDTAMKVVDTMAADLVEECFDKALKPSKGRWLGLLEGHHFTDYRDGTTSDQHLARLLDTVHLGTSAYVRLLFMRGTSVGGVNIWCHHGTGGGKLLGSSLNRIESLIKGFEADVYLVGHDTKKVSGPIDRIEPWWPKSPSNPPQLIHRTKIIASTGGFMKGYVAGSKAGQVPRGGYVEKGMMNPTALGGILLKIRPRWIEQDGASFWLPDFNVEL